ncbi:MAG: bifunctional glutamate N-acetyltransferase/amino-acid acetyltransferase ArgJ [Clostridiales bacterium]|nr:bifunctional glutamate N-acetyltransferase/amino-acid acetyltransferase ArgJ [Clostridiales bacterium]
MEFINGGVTAPKGFRASGICSGIKKNTAKNDLALIMADALCDAAAVYTTNRVKAAPVFLTKSHLSNGKARAILANSGNANACAPNGEENALRACEALSKAAGIAAEDIIINSTGVIGQPLPIEKIEAAIPLLAEKIKKISPENKEELLSGGDEAVLAIMTTDTVKKQAACTFKLGGAFDVTVGAIAKGSGMIHPNMATMLCFITTDCNISSGMLQKALSSAARRSFNRVSVDGDTSTNDMTAILASGLAGNPLIAEENEDYKIFAEALEKVCVSLAKRIAADGEGATKLITCRVTGAADEASAEKLSMSVTSSSLVKTAMTGADANFGRVLCALGYAGADFDPEAVDISFESAAGKIPVCKNGRGLAFDETLAKEILSRDAITITCDMNQKDGGFEAETYGCDLTCDYVKINGDYRS